MYPEFHHLGKILIILGAVIVIIGGLFLFGDKIPLIGKLPGDISIKRKNFSLYFPIATTLLLSLIISLIIYLFKK